MKRVMVRYKLKPDQVEANEGFVRGVFEELHQTEPDGFGYATFKLDDGVSFVHIASYEDGGAGSPLLALSAFKAFTAAIRERCEEPPVTATLTEVGSFRFFGAH